MANARETRMTTEAEKFMMITKTYDTACAALRVDSQSKRRATDAEYQCHLAPLQAEHQAKCAPLGTKSLQSKRDTLQDEYQAKCLPFHAEYAKRFAALAADCKAKRDALDADYFRERSQFRQSNITRLHHAGGGTHTRKAMTMTEEIADLTAMTEKRNRASDTSIDDFVNDEYTLYTDYQAAKRAAQEADPLNGLDKLKEEFYVNLVALHTKFTEAQTTPPSRFQAKNTEA